MINIARRQLMDGLRDAKFLFLALLVLLAFIANGVVFRENNRLEKEDHRTAITETNRLMQGVCGNLQSAAIFLQRMIRPPSSLAFIAEGGGNMMPNAVVINAFSRWGIEYQQRNNEKIPVLPPIDWSFIVGVMMTLLAVLVSYNAVAGEKKDGTLKLVLSNPVSKLKLFVGKYLGLLVTMLICLLTGVVLNLVVMVMMGGPQLTAETLWPVAWALMLAFLCISAFLLAGIAVSSMTRSPAVALVVLLVLWVLAVFAVPGIGRLAAEQLVKVPSQAMVEEEIYRAQEEIWENRPRDAANWNGNPFEPHVPQRAKLSWDQISARERISDSYIDSQIRQVLAAKQISAVSPYGLLGDSFEVLAGTGVYGFEQLHRNSIAYRRHLYQFVVNRDKSDPDTPHLVYGYYSSYDSGVFSQRPVPFAAIPKPSALWKETGLSIEREWPLWQLLVMLGFNLLAGVVALISLLRYDPR
ncbi:MAG TPA: ABC transporter permease subunit [Acidobacteriota bacterium]|nr:ABC transporter permease subunit [Acidobacteriota bacterium]